MREKRHPKVPLACLEVTREFARQIEKRALQKLRTQLMLRGIRVEDLLRDVPSIGHTVRKSRLSQ